MNNYRSYKKQQIRVSALTAKTYPLSLCTKTPLDIEAYVVDMPNFSKIACIPVTYLIESGMPLEKASFLGEAVFLERNIIEQEFEIIY